LAAGLRDVKDRVDDLAQVGLARASAIGRRRQMRRNHLPLFVGGVACIAQMIALILPSRDFSPGHGVLLGVFANTRESQPLKSRNLSAY
jgi:hypothetical protein